MGKVYTEGNDCKFNIYYHKKRIKEEIFDRILSHPNVKSSCVSSDVVNILKP